MKYDFDLIIDRKGTDSLKWDYVKNNFGENDLLPLWVADMDFEAPKPVIEAVKKRAEHGIYGYTDRPDSCYSAICNWTEKRHEWKIEKEWITYTPGVVTALSIAIFAFTQPKDKILLQSPVYHPFFTSIEGNGRELVNSRLKFEKDRYVIDFQDLEEKISSGVKMMLLCNPHNPTGRVWTREELKKISEICMKYNVLIISDEIHSDIIHRGNKHIPIASLSKESAQNTITCIAPSKTFNIAGLSSSAVIIPNKELLEVFNNKVTSIGVDLGNLFGITAMEAAYSYGEEWLEQLLDYLEGNIDFVLEYVKERIPGVRAIKPEATYLMWLDFSSLGISSSDLRDLMIKKAKVALNDGTVFGPGGEGFQRINIGCPRSVLKEGLKRIEEAVKSL